MKDKKVTEILDEFYEDVGREPTAQASEDTFAQWQSDEEFDETGTTDGVYLGDGIYKN